MVFSRDTFPATVVTARTSSSGAPCEGKHLPNTGRISTGTYDRKRSGNHDREPIGYGVVVYRGLEPACLVVGDVSLGSLVLLLHSTDGTHC